MKKLHCPTQNPTTFRLRTVPTFILFCVNVLLKAPFVCASEDDSSHASSLTYQEVLANHDRNDDSQQRHFPDLNIFGFVTPWNSAGKDVAVLQSSKGRLDYVSPVSWQMLPDKLAGGHDFDDSFYADLFRSGARIYPRVLFEAQAWSTQDLMQLSKDPSTVLNRITTLCSDHKFEGVVVEIWQALLATGVLPGKEKDHLINFVNNLGESLRRDAGLRTVLVLPPYGKPESNGGVGPKDIERLKTGFNHFIVMTYDFSTPGSRPGPVAPIFWVKAVVTYLAKDCGLREKLLVGLNFYGIDFVQRSESQTTASDKHVVGDEVITLLQRHKPDIVWLQDLGEHGFAYEEGGTQHIVFYPTRESVAQRVSLAKELGCGGVAVWELGQGLNHFFEEL